jgi:hypothetical protein
MTCIYTVTSIVPPKSEGKWPGDSRAFGWFATHEEALLAVRKNQGEMSECRYSYIVIERSYPGIHALAEAIYWAEWNTKQRCWKRCKRPRWSLQIVNWALG